MSRPAKRLFFVATIGFLISAATAYPLAERTSPFTFFHAWLVIISLTATIISIISTWGALDTWIKEDAP
jgi:hypothetical protein